MNAVVAETAPLIAPRIPIGAHLGLAPEIYYQRVLGEANNSALTVIDEFSPAHYLYWVEHPEDDEESDALSFGKLLHCLLLEPERFAETYVVVPPTAPSRACLNHRDAKKPSPKTLKDIAWWDEFNARNAGKITAPDKDIQLATDMVAAARASEVEIEGTLYSVGDIVDVCEKEVTLSWIDEETGLPCKLRADLWLPDAGFCADPKSTFNASKSAFAHSITRFRYHVQSVHYAAGFDACGYPLRTFAFLPMEKRKPHVCAYWQVDTVSQETGWRIRQRSMRKLAACVASGRFPGYTTTVEPIGIPAYGHFDADKD